MKKRTLVTIVSGMMAAGSVIAAPHAMKSNKRVLKTSEIRFSDVNSVVNAIAGEAVSLEMVNGDNFSFVTPTFDASRSSLLNESIAYSTSAEVKNAPWSQGQGKFGVVVDTYFKTDRVSQFTGMNITAKVSATTDFLELTRYSAKLLEEKNRIRYDQQYEARERSIISRLKVVSTMSDLHQILLDLQNVSIDLVDREILRKIDLIKCTENLTCGIIGRDEWGNPVMDNNQYLYAQVDLRNYMQGKNLILGNDIAFDGTQIKMTQYPAQLLTDNQELGSFNLSTLTFSAAGLQVETKGFVRVLVPRLDKLHRTLEREFTWIENNDSQKHARLQQSGRELLRAFRQVMVGNQPSPVSDPFDHTDDEGQSTGPVVVPPGPYHP